MNIANGIFLTTVTVIIFLLLAHLPILATCSSVNLLLKSSDDIGGRPRTLEFCISIEEMLDNAMYIKGYQDFYCSNGIKYMVDCSESSIDISTLPEKMSPEK